MPGGYQLFWVSLPEVAEKRARELLPKIIIIDDALVGTSASHMVRRFRQQVPKSACVVAVNATNTREAQQAVLEGARAFLIKPIHGDDLLSVIEQIMAEPEVEVEEGLVGIPIRPMRKGRAVVIVAPKHGVGHTTLAVNTAIAIHQLSQKKVALVDADFRAPGVDLALNLHEQYTIYDLLPRVSHLDESMIMSVMTHHTSGIYALPSPPPQRDIQPIPLPQVQEIILALKEVFTWQFIDLQTSPDDTFIAFLESVDGIILCLSPELTVLRNARLLLDLFAARGYPQEKTVIVLNRWDMKGGIPVSEIERRLRIEIAYRIPDDQPLATYSNNRGVPLILSHPKSALAKAYLGLARHLMQYCSATDDIPHPAVALDQSPGRLSFIPIWKT